jgi:hypothetical protein
MIKPVTHENQVFPEAVVYAAVCICRILVIKTGLGNKLRPNYFKDEALNKLN